MLSVKTSAIVSPPGDSAHPTPMPGHQPLLTLFVAALTQDSDTAWRALLDHLDSLPPAALRELRLQPETQHYIHRAVQHDTKHSDRVGHLGITRRLATIFPEEVERFRTEDLLCSYSYSDVTKFVGGDMSKTSHSGLKKKRRKRAASVDSSTRDLFTFSPSQIPVTYRGPPLKLKDLTAAATLVSYEASTARQNSLFPPATLHPAGTATRTSESLAIKTQRSHSSQGFYTPTKGPEKPSLSPVLSSEIEESCLFHLVSPRSAGKRVHFQHKFGQSTSSSGPFKDAFDVIEAFAMGKLHTESEPMYLNYSNSTPWNPYSLVVVPKMHASPEHFVISKFGILHIYPDGDCDLQNFAEWLQEASLFTMLRKIPFFRLCILRKSFSHWRRNVRYNQFLRVHNQVIKTSLRFFPSFSDGILKIQNLNEELLSVPFHTLLPLGGYSQEAFEQKLESSQAKLEKFLQRYFKYCRRIVAEVIESTQSHALKLEMEKRHQPFVSELPLSIQKEKHAKLERDLEVAQYRVTRLSNFVTLADNLVMICLLKLARQSVESWIRTTLKQESDATSISGHNPVDRNDPQRKTMTPVSEISSESDREAESRSGARTQCSEQGTALLLAELRFGEAGTLTIHPSSEELEVCLLGPLQSLTPTLSAATQALTGHPAKTSPSHSGMGKTIKAGNSRSSPLSGMETASIARPSTELSIIERRGQSMEHPRETTDLKEGRREMLLSTLPQKPKSLVKALRGLITDPPTSGLGERHRESALLESERAKQWLRAVEEGGRDGEERRIGMGVRPSALSEEKLKSVLERDEVLRVSLSAMCGAVNGVREEIKSICHCYSWMQEVWQFMHQWEGWDRMAALSAEEFEATLVQLYQWTQDLSLLPPHLSTPHSLVCVGTGELVGTTLPQLSAILAQLKARGLQHARRVCDRVLEQTKRHSEGLFSKRYDLEGFAEYARQLRESRAFHQREAPNINYVCRVHSVLLRQGVEVPPEDRGMGKELQSVWRELGQRLVEAGEFVDTQTPIKAQGLQESIESCEEELKSLVAQVNEGSFVEPAAVPSGLLERLKVIQEEVMRVKARLLGLSKWKEAITGKPHNLTNIASLMNVLFVRQELWKYRRVFNSYEREWMKTPFKKLDIAQISQRVTDWLEVCSKLEQTLPPGDPVLEGWRERLDHFKKGIPLLKQLASKALRTSHWFTIFAALGEDYLPFHHYTLTDFALYNIYGHSDIIFEICHNAMQEEKLQAEVVGIQEMWENKTLSVVQTPLDQYSFALASEDHFSARKPLDKMTTFAISFSQPSLPTFNYLCTIDNGDEVQLLLEDNITQLKVVLSSPHLGSLRSRAETLLTTLRQLQELISLIGESQQKWWNLLSLFSHMESSLRPSHSLEQLQQTTRRFQEVTRSIYVDPRVLSLLGKRRGQKGSRELQGDPLRYCLHSILSSLESVLQKVHSKVEEACVQFPRLCYLSDGDVLKVLAHRGIPVTLIPLIKKMFSSVFTLRFTEIIATHSPSRIGTDTEEGFQLIAVEGSHGEQLPLVSPLSLGKKQAPLWLNALGGAVKYSLACTLTQCKATFPEGLMGVTGDHIVADSVHQWLSSHPQQSVLLSLELKWASAIYIAMTSDAPSEQLQQIRTKLHIAVDVAVELLRSLYRKRTHPSSPLPIALHNVIILLRHKTDLVKSLIENKAFSPATLLWKGHIHYTSEGEFTSQLDDGLATHGRPSVRSSLISIHSIGNLRHSDVAIQSSHSSLDQRSLVLTSRLRSTVHSLVASSKSLLSSKQMNEPHSFAGTSPLGVPHPSKCMVHCSDLTLPYGFEYYGCDSRLVLTPPTEACLLSLATAIGDNSFSSITGPPAVGKTKTAEEVAKVLGRHCYQFQLSPLTRPLTLHRLLSGALRAGGILLLEGSSSLVPTALVSLGEYLQSLATALARAFATGKTSHPGQSQSSELSEGSRPTSRIDWYREESLGGWLSSIHTTATVEFAGQVLSARSTFGCVLVESSRIEDKTTVFPQQLKSTIRPISLLKPSLQCVGEVLLLSHGFTQAHLLSGKLVLFLEYLHQQVSVSSKACCFGLLELKEIVSLAAVYLSQSIPSHSGKDDEYGDLPLLSLEFQAVTNAIKELCGRRVAPVDSNKVMDLLEAYFPDVSAELHLSGRDTILQEALKSQFSERHLQSETPFMDKIQELHSSLSRHRFAILTGLSGSGKSTAYRMLAAAYHHIRELQALGKHSSTTQGENYPRVDITVINPGAYSTKELFGCHQQVGGELQWRSGILTCLLRNMESSDHLKASLIHPDGKTLPQNLQSCPVPVRHWMVLDGPVRAGLMEALTALVSLEGLCLSNGEKLFLPDSCQLLVETPSLFTLPPSLISHCTLIHFGRDIMHYEALIDTWLDRAPTKHNLSAMSTETLAKMVKHLLPDALAFIQETNTKHAGPLYTIQLQSRVFGITETQCFLNLLSAVLERNSPKTESSLGYPGTASQSSRVSSRIMESRVSSALLSSYSSTSVQEAYGTPRNVSHPPSRVDMHTESGALDLMLADNEDAMSDFSNLEVEIGLTLQIQMAAMLAFSYIWSIGAFVPFSELSSFDEFARDQIMQLPFAVSLPEEGSVFDYFLDLRRFQFLPWTERGSGSSRCSGGYITLPELDRYAYIIDLYLSYGFNVMIIGEQGTGKTAFVEHLLHSRLPLTRIPITYTFTSSLLHHSILGKVTQLEKRGQRLGRTKKTTTQRCIFFLDDLHLASKSFCTSGDYPVLETVQFAVSQNALIDPSRVYQHDLHNVRYIATCVPAGLSKVAPKLLGIFNPVPFLPPSDECLHTIFSKSVQLWLQQFSPSAIGDAEFLAKAIAAASVVVFRSVAEKFHPNPSQPHYLFTMHDLLHVYEGLLLMSPDTKAHTHPQFNLLNRRGFLSSTQSGRVPKKTKSGKTKSGKKISLPSLRGGYSLTRGSTKARGRSLSIPGPESQSAETTTMLRMLIRLWCHENTRVYTDRLVDSKDRMWFLKLLEACLKYCFSGNDFQSSTTATQPLVGHTATHGGRRIRGGRTRTNILPQSEGPSLASLAASGVKVEALQRLTPRDPEKGLLQLIPYEQLTMRGEDLTGLIFAQFPTVGKTEENRGEAQQEEGSYPKQMESSPTVHKESGAYSELGDGQVMETLTRHLENCSSTGEKLALFRGAIEHATRLCRVMSLPGSHALLLGSKGTGRKSLTRLVAHIIGAELFELGDDGVGQQEQEYVRRQLREVCISAGSEQKHSALLVSSSGHWNPQTWQSICHLMNEGFCAGLFTSSELLVMSSKLQQGKMKKTADGAQQAFARSVQKNLHIFITWNIERKTGSPFEFSNSRNTSTFKIATALNPGATVSIADLEESRRAMFAALCRVCSYIDHYHPWSKQAYSDIALQKWQQSESPTWQSWADTGSQLEAVSILAAHVHLTTVELLHRTMPHVTTELVSPKTFTECLRVTQNIAIRLKAQEKATADRLQAALHKLEEVDHTVIDLEQQLASLRPRLSSAEKEVQQRMALITAAKERYMEANRWCRSAEETIETESQNVEHLNEVVQQKFGEVFPVYHSALEALSSVKKNDVLEVMSYREPPSILTPIFNALCMLFDRPQTWEDCKELLLSRNFFESLRFFDRDNVPVHKLHKLEKMVIKKTSLDSVEYGSKAAVPLCMWLAALVDYHKTKMVVQPFRDRLAEAEKTLIEAEKTFVAMKKDMMETKAALEETIKLHREGVQKARHIETEIKAVQTNLDKANHILSFMLAQRQRWDEELKATWSRIDSVAGHAILCAASTTYLAFIPADQHKKLMSNWLGYCSGAVDLGSLATQGHGGLQSSQAYHSLSGGQQQVVRIERNFVVQNVLSDREERFLWQQEATFPDEVTLERCLAARTSCRDGSHQWPLVADPHEQFWKYLRAIEHKEYHDATSIIELKKQSPQYPSTCSSLVIFKLSEAELSAKLQDAISSGKTTALILDFPPTEDKTQITNILKRDFTRDSSNKFCLELEDDAIPVHPDFRLYVITEQYLGSDQASQVLRSLALELSDFSVVNLNLSREGLQSHLQRFIMNHERPEFSIRYKSLITDLALHHQQFEDSQEKIVHWTLTSEDSLLQHSSLLQTVRENESAESNACDQILETMKILRIFDQRVEVYRPLAEYATILFGVVQKLSETFQYFKLGLNQFQGLVADLIAKYKDRRVADDTMAMNAHILHLKHELLLALCRALQPVAFQRHQTLFPLLVSLEMLLAERKAMEDEYQLLGKELNPVEVQLEILLNSSELNMDKPHWISDQVWCAAMELQNQLPALRKLGASISSNASEWKEYFELPPSLFVPVHSMGDSVSMCHKLLLWKTFRPDKFVDVAKQFVTLTVGPEVAQTEPSTVDSILPHTKPEVPVVCLLPFDVQDTQSAVLEVKTSAVAQGRSFFSVSLVDDQSLDNLLIQLPNFIGNGTWVAVGHCHFSPNWHQVLASLIKAVTSHPPTAFSSKFRMWVLLPVDVCSGLEFGEDCLKVALESSASTVQIKEWKGDGGSLCARRSLKMLQDIQLVMYSSAKPLHSSWEKHRPIISKLQSFIPLPLSESELSELKECDMQGQSQSQSLLALFSEELSTHNAALEVIHASLQTILGYFSGNLPFSASLGHFLGSLSRNEIPNEWQYILPLAKHQIRLVPALKLLKSRVKFYTNRLQSGMLPKTLHPLLFSNPSDFFSRVMHSFAQMHQLFADSVMIDAKLTIEDSESDIPEGCITLRGLTLHGATWNTDLSHLEPLNDCNSDKFPVLTPQEYCVTILPASTVQDPSAMSSNIFECPVVLAKGLTGQHNISPLFHIPLKIRGTYPVCIHDPTTSLFLACDLPV